jgi:hypothetical protein
MTQRHALFLCSLLLAVPARAGTEPKANAKEPTANLEGAEPEGPAPGAQRSVPTTPRSPSRHGST